MKISDENIQRLNYIVEEGGCKDFPVCGMKCILYRFCWDNFNPNNFNLIEEAKLKLLSLKLNLL
jgi:hypothetical protein